MNEQNTFTDRKNLVKNTRVTPIGIQTWLVITILGIAGQLAWSVENSWFNVFVYDEITEDPTPVAWMVAVSAVTATVTTILIGALSDRTQSKMGKRKPYILFGYILWGIITALFPMVELIQQLSVAVFMVVFMDAVMTIFGSTANDACFNAWITDITDHTNRGRVQGILMMTTLIANLIAIGASGFIIDAYGYFIFFYFLGGIVSIAGFIAGILVKEPPQNYPDYEIVTEKSELVNKQRVKKSFWKDIIYAFRPNTIKHHPLLYVLLSTMALINIGGQVSAPYLFVYLENYLGFSKGDVSIVGGVVILISAIASVIYGLISHRMPRDFVLLITILSNSILSLLFALIKEIIPIILLYSVILSLQMINSIVLESWIQDLYPPSDRGKFQGVRMVAFVAIPMIFGPIIGNAVIHRYGIPSIIQEGGYIPTSEIFIFGGLVSLFALIPAVIIILYKKKRK
ncbi:MFS transporter [Candidatus Harpocratesius sp.]